MRLSLPRVAVLAAVTANPRAETAPYATRCAKLMDADRFELKK